MRAGQPPHSPATSRPTNETTSAASHRGDGFSREYEVSLVLTVDIIDENDEFARLEVGYRLGNRPDTLMSFRSGWYVRH